MIRAVFRFFSIPVIWFFKPFKIYAYKTRFRIVRNLILEFTTLVDFVLILFNIQNETMLLHYRVYKGNFIFGKSVMLTDYESARSGSAGETIRGSNFMGLNIVSTQTEAFATNTGMINQNPPVRDLVRGYVEENILTEEIRNLEYKEMQARCHEILEEWQTDSKMGKMLSIRGAATRIVLRLIANKTIPKDEADQITWNYYRRFGELSIFGRYLPVMLGLLASRENMRRDAYLPLKRHGIDIMAIDMTLFAAMFSIGTLVMKCVEYIRANKIDYEALREDEKYKFVVESVRLYPTVTCTHRIVEEEQTVKICVHEVKLRPGDEIAYPLICTNQDKNNFKSPNTLNIDRPEEELQKVMSWSTGPHRCPAKELSILITVLMLDTLSLKFNLRKLKIFNPTI